MRSAAVLTNETCNQGCAFCDARRPVEQPALVHPRAVRARLERAAREGAERVVLTGGEPALRRDLEALVAHARALPGVREVALETNATLLDEARARALAAAGLTHALVHTPGLDETYERTTRDPGSYQAFARGLDALGAAGVAVVACVPLVRSTRAALDALPALLAARFAFVRALEAHAPLDGPEAAALLAPSEALDAALALFEAARRVGLRAAWAPGAALPVCLFARPERVAHAYALSRGGARDPAHARVPACAACEARDRCPGVPSKALAREPALAERARPVRDDRLRRRLTVVRSVDEQIARELVSHEWFTGADGAPRRGTVVRVHFHCNQACAFCFVSTHLPPPERAHVERAIAEAGARGDDVALSGGEPTLNASLERYVTLAREAGAAAVELQSNAVRFAGDPGYAHALRAAGLDRAMVSLHAHEAALSDAITDAPGTFDKTLRGVDALRAAGVAVRLNHVLCAANAPHFERFVRFVAERFGPLPITVSLVGTHTDVVPRSEALVPRLPQLAPALAAGVRAAGELGVALEGFTSMCGLPPCALPEETRAALPPLEPLDATGGGEFRKPDACARCAYTARCYGLRRGYVELYGEGDVVPIEAPSDYAPGANERGEATRDEAARGEGR